MIGWHVTRWMAIAFVLLGAAFAAGAQLPATSATDHASHAWVIAQVPGEKSATLVHVPPRTATSLATPAAAGRLKAAASLNEAPIHLASDGATVYMIFDKGKAGAFEVAQLSAVPTGIQDNWVRQPRDRLKFLPSIEGVDQILGFACDNATPTALVSEDDEYHLLAFDAGKWTQRGEVQLSPSDDLSVQVFAGPGRLHIVEQSQSTLTLNTLYGEEWSSVELSSSEATADFGVGQIHIAGVYADEVIGILPGQPRHEVWSLSTQGAIRLGSIDPPGSPLAATILQSTGRLLIVWTNPDERTTGVESSLPTPDEVSNPVRRVIEFSLIEGQTVYAGPAVISTPVTQSEFRNLALLMMLLMGLVLIVVLRPPANGAVITLPPGLAIAGPGRRTLATLFDGLLGVVIVARVMDLSVLDVLGPFAVPATGRLDLGPLFVALMINVFHCSVGEAVFGRTIGKSLMGLIVARVDKSSAALPAGQFKPPTPMRALGRNLIKWLLPPVAMLALSDPGGRHRGDLLAGTAVLCRANPPLSDD